MNRRILHVDMDAFFAAVELKRHPELAGRPLIIGGRGIPSERGVVSTASYEARRYGIHSAMPLRTAHRLCPQAVFLAVDYAEYERVSRRIKALLCNISPVVEDAGIDEAFLDITAIPEPSETVARRIKAGIWKNEGLTCSVGIAPNKLLAKIASDMEKPDGLTILTMEDISLRLWSLPVRRLPGVGPKTEEALHEMGIRTIGELAAVSIELLKAQFGQAHGQYLAQASHGMDDSPLITHWESKSLSRQITFQQDVRHPSILAETLANEVRELAAALRAEGYRARTVTVKLRFSDFTTHTHELTLPEFSDAEPLLLTAAVECLRRFQLNKPVRLLGVRFGSLHKIGGEKQGANAIQ